MPHDHPHGHAHPHPHADGPGRDHAHGPTPPHADGRGHVPDPDHVPDHDQAEPLAAAGAAPVRALALVPLGDGPAPADRLTLPYDARWRRRGRLVTEGGEAILLDLPRAEELAEDRALALEDGRRVALVAAPEPVAEVSAQPGAGPDALARLAWHVGNRHTPAEIVGGRLRILRDHVLEDMLTRLGAEIRHAEAAFRPEGGAYGLGRTHGHSHSRDPHHDPDAHLRDGPDPGPDSQPGPDSLPKPPEPAP